ncbi:MAG: dihydrodipicolinate synthase family protein [Clostridia bacterium]|nr:dihydrodipicolinate synthase family protein [Clostridia bacterium]
MSEYRPKGAFGVLLTPFDEGGKVNYDVFEKEVEFLASSDIDGLFPSATTGEFVHMSPEENIEILKFTAKVARGRKQMAAGACSSNFDTTVSYMKAAADAGYNSAVICVPYYITLPQEDVYEYFKRLARENIIDIVLYNIPMFTGEISINVFKRLLEEKNIVGIKDSSAHMKRIAHLIDIVKHERPDFSVLSGTDDCLVPALTCGCCGSMTAFSTILPEVNAAIYRKFARGDIKGAQELNSSYLSLIRLADSIAFPAGYKLIMEMRGYKMGQKQIVHELGTQEYQKLMENVGNELLKVVDFYVKNK